MRAHIISFITAGTMARALATWIPAGAAARAQTITSSRLAWGGRGRGENPGASRFGGRNLQGGRFQQRQLIGTARQQPSGNSDMA